MTRLLPDLSNPVEAYEAGWEAGYRMALIHAVLVVSFSTLVVTLVWWAAT